MSDQEEASALGKAMEDLAEEDRALLLPDDVDAFEHLVGDLKPATRRKRKERLMRRLRKSVQEIFQSRGQGDD